MARLAQLMKCGNLDHMHWHGGYQWLGHGPPVLTHGQWVTCRPHLNSGPWQSGQGLCSMYYTAMQSHYVGGFHDANDQNNAHIPADEVSQDKTLFLLKRRRWWPMIRIDEHELFDDVLDKFGYVTSQKSNCEENELINKPTGTRFWCQFPQTVKTFFQRLGFQLWFLFLFYSSREGMFLVF